jgi:hypothetical protein
MAVPFQWNESKNGGFTGEPWLKVNEITVL